MKQQRPPLRLGSFEQLESRAMLAHAGAPRGMFFEGGEQRPSADFERSPTMEMQSRGVDSFAGRRGGDFSDFDHSPRGAYSFFSDSNALAVTFTAPIYEAPASTPSYSGSIVQILVITTVPPPPTPAPQFSEPLTNPPYDALRQQIGNGSFANPPPSNLQAPQSPSRTSSAVSKSLDSLSVLSSLSLKQSSTEATASKTDDNVAATEDHDERTATDDQDTATPRPTAQAAANPPQTNDTDETELIELDPEELLKHGKRKVARATTSPQIEAKLRESTSVVRESMLRSPRSLERTADHWLTPADVEEVIAPVDDGLIELLASDPVEAVKPTAVHSQPFAPASAAAALHANLGYYQAIENADLETTPATIPAVQPADVAAALPLRAAQ